MLIYSIQWIGDKQISIVQRFRGSRVERQGLAEVHVSSSIVGKNKLASEEQPWPVTLAVGAEEVTATNKGFAAHVVSRVAVLLSVEAEGSFGLGQLLAARVPLSHQLAQARLGRRGGLPFSHWSVRLLARVASLFSSAQVLERVAIFLLAFKPRFFAHVRSIELV